MPRGRGRPRNQQRRRSNQDIAARPGAPPGVPRPPVVVQQPPVLPRPPVVAQPPPVVAQPPPLAPQVAEPEVQLGAAQVENDGNPRREAAEEAAALGVAPEANAPGAVLADETLDGNNGGVAVAHQRREDTSRYGTKQQKKQFYLSQFQYARLKEVFAWLGNKEKEENTQASVQQILRGAHATANQLPSPAPMQLIGSSPVYVSPAAQQLALPPIIPQQQCSVFPTSMPMQVVGPVPQMAVQYTPTAPPLTMHLPPVAPLQYGGPPAFQFGGPPAMQYGSSSYHLQSALPFLQPQFVSSYRSLNYG